MAEEPAFGLHANIIGLVLCARDKWISGLPDGKSLLHSGKWNFKETNCATHTLIELSVWKLPFQPGKWNSHTYPYENRYF